MIIFSFINEHLISINGEIFIYNENLLQEIIKYKKIFIVNYPGSYTGIRKSISIATAIKIFNPSIEVFGLNLLTDFAILFSKKVFFIEKHIIHCYNPDENPKIYLVGVNQEQNLIDQGFLGNNIIDFSLQNILKYIDLMPLKIIQQEYYDKFS